MDTIHVETGPTNSAAVSLLSLDLFTAVHLLRVSPLYYKSTANGTNGVRELLLTNLQVCRGYGITMEIPVGVGMRWVWE